MGPQKTDELINNYKDTAWREPGGIQIFLRLKIASVKLLLYH